MCMEAGRRLNLAWKFRCFSLEQLPNNEEVSDSNSTDVTLDFCSVFVSGLLFAFNARFYFRFYSI